MHNASLREVSEYSNRVRLEVGVEFFGGYLEGQGRLLKAGILGLCLG